jgi:hypothetical protein
MGISIIMVSLWLSLGKKKSTKLGANLGDLRINDHGVLFYIFVALFPLILFSCLDLSLHGLVPTDSLRFAFSPCI